MRANFGWGCISLLPSAPYSIHDASHSLVLGIAFERQRGVHALGAGRRRDFDAWPGELAVTSPDVEMFSESRAGGEYLALHVAPAASGFETELPLTVPRTVLRGDRRAVRWGMQLRRAMLAPHPQRQLIEHEAMNLLAHGLSRSRLPHRPAGGYDRDRRAHSRVLEYIDEAIDGALDLDELARVARMPVLRFLRSFSAATGSTPHAYITERRMQRARVLLSTTGDSIAGIAGSCGFAHQSHLGAVLRARLGLSPRQYRLRTGRA